MKKATKKAVKKTTKVAKPAAKKSVPVPVAVAPPPPPPNVTQVKPEVDPARSAACKRAWDTIRANKAKRAAGIPLADTPTPLGPAIDLSKVKPLDIKSGATIADHAMIVRVTIHQWRATVQDDKITAEVAKLHNIQEGMGAYKKSLLAKDALAKVESIFGKIRSEHNKWTLPWNDNSYRVLSSACYFDYNKAIRELISQVMDELEREFYPNYEVYKSGAKQALNGGYNEADYPTINELKRKFGVDVNVLPVPTGNDFRVVEHLSKDDVKRIRHEIEDEVTSTIQAGMSEVWTKIRDVVTRLVDRVKEYDPESNEGKTIGQPLVDAVHDVLDMVPILNITKDPALDKFATAIRADVIPYTAKVLRENPGIRAEVAKRADAILDRLSDFI